MMALVDTGKAVLVRLDAGQVWKKQAGESAKGHRRETTSKPQATQ